MALGNFWRRVTDTVYECMSRASKTGMIETKTVKQLLSSYVAQSGRPYSM